MRSSFSRSAVVVSLSLPYLATMAKKSAAETAVATAAEVVDATAPLSDEEKKRARAAKAKLTREANKLKMQNNDALAHAHLLQVSANAASGNATTTDAEKPKRKRAAPAKKAAAETAATESAAGAESAATTAAAEKPKRVRKAKAVAAAAAASADASGDSTIATSAGVSENIVIGGHTISSEFDASDLCCRQIHNSLAKCLLASSLLKQTQTALLEVYKDRVSYLAKHRKRSDSGKINTNAVAPVKVVGALANFLSIRDGDLVPRNVVIKAINAFIKNTGINLGYINPKTSKPNRSYFNNHSASQKLLSILPLPAAGNAPYTFITYQDTLRHLYFVKPTPEEIEQWKLDCAAGCAAKVTIPEEVIPGITPTTTEEEVATEAAQ
jgi:hypothetical protein